MQLKPRLSGLLRSDIPHYFVLLIATQGTVLVSQALAAVLVPLPLIGEIRSFESVASILVLLAGVGAPTVAIRELAASDRTRPDGLVRRDLLLLTFLGTLLVGGASLVLWPSPLSTLLTALGVVLLICLVRLWSATVQGLLGVRRVTGAVMVGSALAIVAQLSGALTGTINGWMWGRLVGEATLFGAIWLSARAVVGRLPLSAPFDITAFIALAWSAVKANAGLGLRVVADALPILWLNYQFAAAVTTAQIDIGKVEIGLFGVVGLLLLLMLLPLGVMTQRAIPTLTGLTKDREAGERRYARHLLMLAAGQVAASFVLALLAAQTLRNGTELMWVALPIMLSVPAKAVALSGAAILLARGFYSPSIIANLVELTAMLLFLVIAVQVPSAMGASVAVLLGAGCSAIVIRLLLWRRLVAR